MPSNFVGQLKELLDKDKGGMKNPGLAEESHFKDPVTYDFSQEGIEPFFQATVVVLAGWLGLRESLRCTGIVCQSKKAAQQSAAESALNKLQPKYGSESETASGTSTPEASNGYIILSPAVSDGHESDLLTKTADFVPEVHRILLTGGPCGAKSTGIAMLKQILPGHANVIVHTIEDFADMNVDVLGMPMDSGRGRCIQEERESSAFSEAMCTSQKTSKPVVLLIDRGVIERELEHAPPHAPKEVLEKYDTIVHMMSPAVDKPEFYRRIEKHGKPGEEVAFQEDLQVRRCYQKHCSFKVLWNGPDKGQAIPVWLGWKMKELLCVVQTVCCTEPCKTSHSQLCVVDEWLRSRQLREAFGCEKDAGAHEVHPPLTKLLLKHLDGKQEWVTKFFDHVRFVCPLDNKQFTESLPESLRSYVHSHMPGILADEASCTCCADKEQTSGKPGKVASELLLAYDEAFKGQPPKVENFVDIGSGTCTTASAVSRQLGLGKHQVTCLDIADSCGQHADDVTFMTFDGQTLPLPTGSTDLISVIHVLHHVEPGGSSMFHLLQEAKRVLKPGGVVIVKEHDSPNKDYDLYLEAMHSLKQLVFYTNEPEKMPLGSYQSAEEWQVTFRRIGLPVVHVKHTHDIYNSVILVLENIADG